ncbi:MAG: ribonuclease III [Roseovarius sp.]|nr:ribonuclease III [Roseovarius sp.]
MKLCRQLKAFEIRLGYEFSNPELLARSLTHCSMSASVHGNNQRLEFLGDRVLGMAIAEAILAQDDDAAEGSLARRLNELVRKETCSEMAGNIDLGSVLRLGRSEMKSGGRRKTAVLGDAMEAVIAAVYLDSGYETARDVILRHWGSRIADAKSVPPDSKTALQEWAQARGLSAPEYLEISREGPDHAPEFLIEAKLDDKLSAMASAGSKRQAEQAAAKTLLGILASR